MLPALRLAPVVLVGLLAGSLGLSSCAQADEPEGSPGSSLDASTGDAAGAAGTAGAAGMGGDAGSAGSAGLAGSAGAGDSGAAGSGAGGSGGTATGGSGGYAGTGGTGFGGAAGSGDAGIICGGEVCTDWLCENTGIGLSVSVFGCCQQTNECGAVNDQGGALCVPVAVVESLLNLSCKAD